MISLQNVVKTYEKNGQTVYALNDITLQVPAGDFLAITGKKGYTEGVCL